MHFSSENKNTYFLGLICIMFLISFLGKNILSILFLVILIFLCFKRSILRNYRQKIIILFFLIIFLLYWYIQSYFDINFINFLIDKSKIKYLRSLSINFIKENYTRDGVKSIVLLMLFNEKTKGGWEIYNQLKLISVCHIVVISGLHLNLLIKLNNKIIKDKHISYIFNSLVLFIICIFLNFSIGSVRVFLMYIIFIFDRRNKLDQLERLMLSATILLFLKPLALFSFGFQMSYLATFAILYVNKIYHKKFLKDLLINFTINIYIMPMLSKMSKTFSLWSFIYSYMFSWIYLIDFICFLFFFIPGIENVYLVNYFITEFSIKSFIQINLIIDIHRIEGYYELIYYAVVFCISWLIYKFKKI